MINMFLPERKKGGGNKGKTKEAVEEIGWLRFSCIQRYD